ncbi:MAG: hypothetical protein ABIJ56_00090 [Pseudomonadota bacterium]
MKIKVECYSGCRGDESPRAIVTGGNRLAVKEIIDMWVGENHRYFKVICENGQYLIRFDEKSDVWEMVKFEAGPFDLPPKE